MSEARQESLNQINSNFFSDFQWQEDIRIKFLLNINKDGLYLISEIAFRFVEL